MPNFLDYLMLKQSLLNNCHGAIISLAMGNNEAHGFPKGINPKVNMIA